MVMSNPRSARFSGAGSPGRVRTDGSRVDDDAPQRPSPPGGGTSYDRYKQQLHAFFNGDKPLPEHLRDMLATRPGATDHGFTEEEAEAQAAAEQAAAPKKKVPRKGKAAAVEEPSPTSRRRVIAASAEDLVLIEAIRKASSPREVSASIDALLARGGVLPKDAEVLGKALGHANDDVLETALSSLRDLITEGSFKGNPTLLKTRIKNVALMTSSSSVRELCTEVTGRLS